MQQAQEMLGEKGPGWPHILIMEDEMSVARGMEMALREEGYAVDLAIDGGSALDSFSRGIFDLLVADLRLPDIDGMEVIRQVKRRRPDTEVLVITGYSTVPTAVEAMKLGASDYLSKPFTGDELIIAVKAALASKVVSASPLETPVLEPLPEDLQRLASVMIQIRRDFSGERAEVIPMLHMVQNSLGFIPQDAMEQIADFIGMSAAAVYGVATFYEYFRLNPVGRHIVRVCCGTACHVKGSDRIINEIAERFQVSPGQTSEDRQITLETLPCLGSCALAPLVVVDDEIKGRMNLVKTRQTMEAVCRAGQNRDKR